LGGGASSSAHPVVGEGRPPSWWTSAFFVEAFYATKDLLGWPIYPGRLSSPAFKLLWTRVGRARTRKTRDAGSIFCGFEQVDENNVPGRQRRALLSAGPIPSRWRRRGAQGRANEIMSGNPQEGTAEDINDDNQNTGGDLANLPEKPQPDGKRRSPAMSISPRSGPLPGTHGKHVRVQNPHAARVLLPPETLKDQRSGSGPPPEPVMARKRPRSSPLSG